MYSRSYMAKNSEIVRRWHLVDAKGLHLGRMATRVADLLRGKKKVVFTHHADCGDFVIVTNAAKIVLTGKKLEQKTYFRHSHKPGGATFEKYEEIMEKNPEKAVRLAVKGMLTKNKLGNKQIKRLKVYKDDVHPHQAQFSAGAADKNREKK